jgi:flagella basal body P-ring formation protein FlgA
MWRLLTIVSVIAFTLPAAAETAGRASSASLDRTLAELAAVRPALKQTVTVADDLVRIGDLVEHAGAVARVPIFRAPDPGSTGAVPARKVIDAVYAYGLTEVDTHGLAEIKVTRSSRDLTVRDMEDATRKALIEQFDLGDPADLSLTFDQTLRIVHLEASATAALQPVRVSYDSHRRRFDVVFDIAGSAILKQTPLHLSGIVTQTGEVVTVVRSVQRGEVVSRSDLAIERRPRASIGRDDLVQLTQAVGLAARQSLRAGQTLRRTDLMRPEVVQRNQAVIIVYEVPGILLTVSGKALEAGAEGDVVSVVNLQSKRPVEATVTGPGRVHVAAVGTRFAALASARVRAGAKHTLLSK